MARLVTKFKYLKPDQEKPIGGYATYIATREGVEKIDESFKLAPATVKQQKLIEKLLRDFPDSATMLAMLLPLPENFMVWIFRRRYSSC